MNNQEKYDELDNIVNTLNLLVDELTDKYYKDMINELKYEAKEEKEKIEQILIKEEEKEEIQLQEEFDSTRI